MRSPLTRRALRDVAQAHRQNHAMLVILLRHADCPLDQDARARFVAELAEIDRRVHEVTAQLHEQALALWPGIDRRAGGDRRVG